MLQLSSLSEPRGFGVHAHHRRIIVRLVDERILPFVTSRRLRRRVPAVQPVIAHVLVRPPARIAPLPAGDCEIDAERLKNLGDAEEYVVTQAHRREPLLPQRPVIVVAHHLEYGTPGERVDPRERAPRRERHARSMSAPAVDLRNASMRSWICGTCPRSLNGMASCSRNSRYGARDRFSTLYATIAEFGMYATLPARLISLV